MLVENRNVTNGNICWRVITEKENRKILECGQCSVSSSGYNYKGLFNS